MSSSWYLALLTLTPSFTLVGLGVATGSNLLLGAGIVLVVPNIAIAIGTWRALRAGANTLATDETGDVRRAAPLAAGGLLLSMGVMLLLGPQLVNGFDFGFGDSEGVQPPVSDDAVLDDLGRLRVPGDAVLHLPAGNVSLTYIDRTGRSDGQVARPRVTVTESATRRLLEVDTSHSYTVGGLRSTRVSFGSFIVSTPGEHRVRVEHSDVTEGGIDATLQLGSEPFEFSDPENPFSGLLDRVDSPVGAGVVGLAVVMIVIGAVLLKRNLPSTYGDYLSDEGPRA